MLVLYTDGITEATSEKEEEFGEIRLALTLERHRTNPQQVSIDSLLADLAVWRNGEHPVDDLSIVALELDESTARRVSQRDTTDPLDEATQCGKAFAGHNSTITRIQTSLCQRGRANMMTARHEQGLPLRVCQTTGALLACLLLQACHYLPMPENNETYPLELQQQSQDNIQTLRLEAETHSLSEKAAFFEARIFGEFRHPEHYLFGEQKSAHQPLKLDLEATALILAGTAAKYAVTNDADDLLTIQKILDSLQLMDDINGRDGFLPYIVESPNLKIIKGNTHSNAYAQLMFAYVTVVQHVPDDATHARIRDQAKAMAEYFLKYQFTMHNTSGQPIEVSDLHPCPWQLSRSRILDLLLISESLNALLPADDPAVPQLQDTIRKAEKSGYLRKIQRLQFHLLGYKIPTHSSDWLNFLRLYTLTRISGRAAYHHAWERHYQALKEEQNPFYAVLQQDHSQRASVVSMMHSFPLTRNNAPILPDETVQLNPHPLFKKHSRTVEALAPLPIYRRPADNLEWKRNPYRTRGHLTTRTRIEYAGIDFYIVYWFGRHYGMIDEP